MAVAPGAEVGAREGGGGGRPKALIIGPLPPPYQGMSIFTRQLLASEVLGGAYELIHLDTADRRTAENMGRLDLTNVVLALRHAAGLFRLLLRHRPEIVYVEVSQNTWAYVRDAVFIYLGHAFGSRVVAHLHGSYFREFYEGASWWCRWLVRSTSRRLAAAAVLGPGLRGIYEGLVPDERIHTVPNGIVDPFGGGEVDRGRGGQGGGEEGGAARGGAREGEQAVAPEPVREEVSRGWSAAPDGGAGIGSAGMPGRQDQLTVLYLGMLFEPKGFLDLLRAAAEFRDVEPRVRFVFAGEWFSERERREADRLIAELGLGDTNGASSAAASESGLVSFVGRVDGAAKWELLAGADIFVFPGYQPEGLPLVILEAMAAGLPVVTTDTGAIRDVVVDGETGVVVGKRDPAGLAAAIRRLASSPALRGAMGRAGRARYLAEFTEERCASKLVELFDHVRKG